MDFDYESGAEDSLFSMGVGEKLLVQDCTNLEWYKGRVVETAPGQIKVHYVGWSTNWDEWIEEDSPRLKKWSIRSVRAKDENTLTNESSRTQESWMCTADMRGFEHGFRNNGQRVRVRDRTFGVLHGVIQDFNPLQGYFVSIQEHQEDRWMVLPDPDVDFAQRVNSGGTSARQVKSPYSSSMKGIARVSQLGFHCKICDRHFSSKSALHIHMGKSMQCKNTILSSKTSEKFAKRKAEMFARRPARLIGRSLQYTGLKSAKYYDEEDMLVQEEEEDVYQEEYAFGATRGGCGGGVVRSFGEYIS